MATAAGVEAHQGANETPAPTIFRFFGSHRERDAWKACEIREMLEEMMEMRRLWMEDLQRDQKHVQVELAAERSRLEHFQREEKILLSDLTNVDVSFWKHCWRGNKWDRMRELIELSGPMPKLLPGMTTREEEEREEEKRKWWDQKDELSELKWELKPELKPELEGKLYYDLGWVDLELSRQRDKNEEVATMLERWLELERVSLPRCRGTVARLEKELDELERKPGAQQGHLQKDQEDYAKELQATPHEWAALDTLVQHWLHWYPQSVRALNYSQLEQRAKQLRHQLPHQTTLLDVILVNQSTFATQSPYLDALLVFTGLFSAVLSAFLVDIRKGLQEDLLLEILHQLQSTTKPFQPTLVSVWVNGLWFSSLAASLTGALVVIPTKLLGRWTINEMEAKAIFSAPERLERRRREIRHLHRHAIFKNLLVLLISIASVLTFTAVVLFFFGLAILLFTTEKRIGISFLAITPSIGVLFFGVSAQILYVVYGK